MVESLQWGLQGHVSSVPWQGQAGGSPGVSGLVAEVGRRCFMPGHLPMTPPKWMGLSICRAEGPSWRDLFAHGVAGGQETQLPLCPC